MMLDKQNGTRANQLNIRIPDMIVIRVDMDTFSAILYSNSNDEYSVNPVDISNLDKSSIVDVLSQWEQDGIECLKE